MASNYVFLAKYWPDMAQLGSLAELYLYSDANTCIYKLGILTERVAQEICAAEKLELPEGIPLADRLALLKQHDLLPKRIDDMFYILRKARNLAVHSGLDSNERAGTLLQLAYNLCGWFMEVYGDWDFELPAYQTPKDTTKGADFAQRLQAQEDRINALLAAGEDIRTAVPEVPQDDRSQKAEEAAKNLPVTTEETISTGTGPVRIDCTVLPALNYAMHHNGINAIRSITLENTTDQAIEQAVLQITANPAFALPLVRQVDLLPRKKSIALPRPKLLLDPEYLAAMTERVTGVLHVELRSGGTVLASEDVETAVLAFDEWHGLSLYPELLSSFVTPNHPDIARIIARATEFMGKWTGDTSMDGYQSQDPNRVLSQAAAIFTAIKEQAIAYINPPASFESRGQRVRLCDMVLNQKLGTCLDLTLLYAACLEAVGLHPLLVSSVGHIFTGLWLEEKMFPECVQDDFSLITKRLASGVNEIAVVETTFVTTGADRSFDDAKKQGEDNMTRLQVECIIDVHRARMSHILPLPHRIQTASGWAIEHDRSFKKENMTAPAKLDKTIRIDPNAEDQNIPKIVQWERKLLDLGMRNTLINLRMTKTQLPILTSSLDELENALADGSEYSILPRPADMRATELTFETLYETGAADNIIQAEFQNKRLRTVFTEAELTRSIKELYRTARSSLEENGANTLYLALGMLRWFENRRSTKARYAPIILLPIEMIRKSAAQGYVIRLRDEEPQMNITLLEKLKQDFNIIVKGTDPLSTDGHGIDIRRVLTILRQAVMDQPHWDVLETASIGIFSFSQFVMWNDIRHRTDDLMRNKVVRSLIEGTLTWDAQPMEIGRQVNESNVLLPMSADASQLFAIQAACQCNSFVLHGPPGTGKSQTITSLIANALAQGKRVLFVAEKMAALEVVQKRLDSIGIGPFCLELHSNKSKKKDVLEQLRQASEVTKTTTAQQYADKAKRIAALREELDSYARQLHTILPCGSDLYTLINDYEGYKDAPELPPFSPEFLQGMNPAAMEQQQLTLERLAAAGHEVGHPSGHPLAAVGCTQYTQNLRSSLDAVIEDYEGQLRSISPFLSDLTAALGEEQPDSFEGVRRLASMGSNMACWYDMPTGWVRAESPQLYFDEVIQMARHFEAANNLEQKLLQRFTPEILTQSGESLMAEFVEGSAKWFLAKAMDLGKLRKKLNIFATAAIDKDDLRELITTLRDQQQERQKADALFQKYGSDLGTFYNGKETDWSNIAHLAAIAQQSARELYDLTGSLDILKYCGKDGLKETVYGLWNGFAPLEQMKKTFDDLLSIRQSEKENWLDGQLALCRAISDHASELKEWIAYVSTAQQAQDLGLGSAVEHFEAGLSHDDLLPAYQKALLKGLICQAIDSSDTLLQFSGAVFNKKIEQYKRMDAQWTQLSQQEIYCRLSSKVPDFTREAAHSSELGILQRCIKSGGRGISIRKLFDQIPNLISRLCPCMLMSPISVAQYLDPNQKPFDIVVFDEASQLPTCKAVGVLARGSDAVIVGDPKQMPPTAFFATNTVDEDNLDVEDLESILDDCLALNMPQTHLLWHYRSRHESLIAFSNGHFYENKLFTFPSVNDRESKVRLVPVEGVFERGKGRKNLAEAQAVVGELKRRCHDAALANQSVGVVTFNISQQNLIDDLLNDACAKDPELEKWAYGSEEPVFIKNLENVQGDERDVILFSIGYGPDEKGKVYMNFGPLNRDGGWRRLNVAVSRARREMVVFSTLKPEQIDLNRTQAEGVSALRAFLEYAQGRALALEETAAKPKSREGIAAGICKALAEEGYDTDLSVGRSAYRIDIGVVDPKQPDRYLLGILLDGDSYGDAKTTRDREIAQVSVLNGLGWNLLRVWSMDWWDNRDKELSRILAKLKALQKAPAPVETPVPEPKLQQRPVPIPEVIPAEAPLYQAAVLSAKLISAEEFTEPRLAREITARIKEVIAAEAPISASLLTKRVVQSYGISRAGSRIQAHMNGLFDKVKSKSTLQAEGTFFWRKDQAPEAYVGFRVSGENDAHRDVRDVPVQEVANAIYTVLHEQVGMAQEDLLREAARKLGYARLGGNVLATLEAGVQYAQMQGGITLGSNGTFVLTPVGTARAEDTLKGFRKEKT